MTNDDGLRGSESPRHIITGPWGPRENGSAAPMPTIRLGEDELEKQGPQKNHQV